MAKPASPEPSVLTRYREFLLENDERAVWAPNSEAITLQYKDADFVGQAVHYNPSWEAARHVRGPQSTLHIVRELTGTERSPPVVLSQFDLVQRALSPTGPWMLSGAPHRPSGLFTQPYFPPGPPAPRPPVPVDVAPAALGHDDSGRLFPVVSTTSISAEVSRLLSPCHEKALTT